MSALRVHHLLCIPLFQGYGYSDGFCENMAACIGRLRADGGQTVILTDRADDICAGCPHRGKAGGCRQNEEEKDRSEDESGEDSVVQKDRTLAEYLKLTVGNTYTFSQLMEMAAQNLTEEIFDESCKSCRWRMEGLCSYEKWKKNNVQ